MKYTNWTKQIYLKKNQNHTHNHHFIDLVKIPQNIKISMKPENWTKIIISENPHIIISDDYKKLLKKHLSNITQVGGIIHKTSKTVNRERRGIETETLPCPDKSLRFGVALR